MKKLLFLLITLAATVPWVTNAQTTVTIGDSTGSQYTLPVNMFYNYSLTQQLYTAEEITESGGGAGTITSISFYYNHTDAFSMDNVRIYMKNVDKESFANSTDMEVVTESDLVFEGTFSSPAQSGWVTITLDTPFEYDGTNNLLVCCYDPINGFPGNSFRFITSGTTESTSVAYYSDSYVPDLTSISSFLGSKSIYQYHNCIQLEINFSGETVCAKPSNVIVSGITADAATLSWKAGNGQTAWQVYCATDTVDFDQISWVSVSDTFHTFTGLTPNTQYTAYVRTVCGSEVSGVRSKTFNTNLIAAQLPFFCDFEDPNVNARWAIRNGDQTNQWYIGSAVNHTEDGANALYISNDNGVTNAYDTASTSAVWAFFDVEFSDANEFALSFDYRVNGEGVTTLYDYMKVFVGTPGDVQAGSYSTPENATQIGAFNLQSAWQNASLSLPGSYANTIQRIYFLWRNDGTIGTNPPASIDNITIVGTDCARPNGLVVNDVSDNFVTLTWQETGSATAWNVAYGPAGFTMDENTNIVTVTGTTATIGNLTPAQMYDFYVRSNCGESMSAWIGPVQAIPGAFIFGVTGDSTITACGLVIYDNGGPDGNYSENCNYTLTVYPSALDSLVSISGTHLCESIYDLLRIYNGTSTDADDLLYSSSSSSSAEVSFGPITSEAGPLTIQFTSDYNVQYAGFAATVSCVSAPSCRTPYDLTVNASVNDATLSWTAPEGQTAWQVYCDTGIVDNDQITWISVTDTFHTFTGLTSNTQYTAYVRAICGSDESDVRTLSFRTNMVAATMPFICDFEDATVNSFWAIENGNQTNQWYIGSAVNQTEGGANALYISNDNGVTNVYDTASTSAVWAFFDVEFSDADEFALSFDYRVNGEGTSTLFDYLKVFIGTPSEVQAGSYSTPENATQVGAFNLQASWQNASLTLPGSYANTTQRIYFLWRNDNYIGTNPPAAVDNISLVAVACAHPTTPVVSNIMGHSADLTWNAYGSPVNIYYKTDADTVFTLVGDSPVNDTTYTLTGLNADTQYEVYVAAVCDDQSENPSLHVSFRTTCTTEIAPYSEDFAGFNINPSACWEKYSGLASAVLAGGSLNPTTSGWNYNSNNVFPLGHPKLNIYGSSCFYWLVSPAIDLSQLSVPVLTFSLALTDFANANPVENPTAQDDDQFMVLVSTDDGATWTAANAIVWNNIGTGDYAYNAISHTDDDIVIPLSQYGDSIIRIAFYGESTVSGNGDNDLHIADVQVKEMTACARPNGLAVSDVSDNSVTLTWQENGSATAWNVAYGPIGFIMDENANIVTVTDTTATIGNLTPSQTYDFYVRSDCGEDASAWRGPVHATPGAFIFGVTGDSTITACGLVIYDNGGLDGNYSDNCNYTLIVYPSDPDSLVSISGTHQCESTYDLLRIYNGTSTDAADLLYSSSSSSSAEVSFGPITSEVGPLTIQFTSDYSVQHAGFAAIVSCVAAPDCRTPYDLTVNVSADEATLSWTAPEGQTAWQVYCDTGMVDYDQISWVSVSDTFYTFTGLTPTTRYTAYVRAICGSDVSDFRTLSFSTNMVAATMPFICDFEDADINSFWAIDNGNQTNQWYIGSAVNHTEGGANALYISNDNGVTNAYDTASTSTVWAFVDVEFSDADEFALSFDYRVNGEGASIKWDYLRVFVGVPVPVEAGVNATPAGATIIGSYNLQDTVWQTVNELLSGSYANTTQRIYFLWRNDSYIGVNPPAAVDNISLVAVACAHPTTPVVSNVTGHSADLTWNAYGSPVNIYFKTDADTVFTLVGDSPVNDTTYTLTGLNADTQYEVYVAAVCDDQSENPSLHVSFRTTCTTEIAPYSEDFAGFNINPSACWEKYSGLASAVLAGGSLNPTTSGWNYNSNNVFPLGHPKLNIYGSSCFYWLVSPAIDLSQLSVPVLTFSLALTDYNYSTPIENPEDQIDDQFMVIVSTDDGATWTAANATVWNNIGTGDYAYNAISHTGDEIVIPLSQYGDSIIRIAFYGESTVSGNGDNDLHIADVQVKEMPTCVRPNGLAVSDVSDNSVTLVWQEEGTATAWNVAYGPAGFTVDENADIVTVTDTTATIGNLTPAQTYDFYVQSNCGDGVSEWRGPVQASPGVFLFGVTGSSSVTACGLIIYDNGGPDGNYSNNCNYSLTVYPSDPDSVVSISGTHQCESKYDLLRIYNGTSTDDADLLYSSTSNTYDEVSFGPVTSTTGPLTIWFTSDYSVQHAGFAAIVSCVSAPDCRAPYDLTVNASADEATVSWTNMDEGATIELYYKESSDSVYTTITASAFTGGNSYVMTNLTPATMYDVYVATLCDNGDTLATPVHTFTTQCVEISTYPFVEDFAPTSPTLSCWTVVNANNDTRTFTYNTSNECMYYPYHSANPADDWLVSPLFVMNGSQIVDFDYWSATSWAENFQVFAIAADGTETALSQIVTVQTDVHQNLILDLSELVGPYQIGIHCVSDADRFNFYVDNFRVRDAEVAELTVDPTSMSFSTIAGVASSAQMAVASSLNLNSDIDVTATAPFEVSTDGSTFSNSITITVSAMFTNDTLYIRYNPSVPGTDNGSVTFTGGTETATITVTGVAADCSPKTLPYTEDFDSYTSGISTGTLYPAEYPEVDLPTCWLFTNRSTSSSEYPMAFLSSSSDYAVSGNCLFFKSSSTTPLYAVLPDLIGDIHDMKLRFTYRNEGSSSSNGTLSVGYMTDPDDVTTFNEVATFAQIITLTTDSVLFNTVPVSVTTANIVFKYTGGTYNNYYLSIDDVTVEEFVPVIIDPTIATEAATAVGQTTATLKGTITNPDNVSITAQGFEWKTTTGGTFSQIAGTGTGGSFTANLTGMAPNTSYTFKAFITFNGNTVYGNEMTFTTLPEDMPEPCEAPTGLHATNIENEAIAIAWDANTAVSDWNVRYHPITEDPWTFVTVNTNSYNITGLMGKTTYEIQVQANCSDGDISGWSGSISVQTTDVGIENYLENNVVLFPNPANDVVNVQCTMNNVQLEGIDVVDVYGKVIRNVVGANNDSPTQINVSGLASGMYFVRVTTEQGKVTKTFVKR